MKRKQAILLLAIALLLAFVLYLALRNPKPPFLPRDDAHQGFASGEACLLCHAPGSVSPQSPNHPVGRDCMRCHSVR